MATQAVDDLTFCGTLRVTLKQSGFPGHPENFLRTKKRHGKVVFGIISATGHLWIRTPEIVFDATVEARGSGDPSAWRVGYLQSISHSHYVGQYANGQEIKYRLNTDHGLLKDGYAGSLFYDGSSPLEESKDPTVCLAQAHDTDALQMAFWPEYSGDPYRPNSHVSKGNHLIRTAGLCRFKTHLAVVNTADKFVVTLAECRWEVNWQGVYDQVSGLWRPTSSPEMLVPENVIDIADVYMDPARSAGPVPFSMLLDQATQFLEIETADGWVPCRESLPVPACSDPATLRRWGE